MTEFEHLVFSFGQYQFYTKNWFNRYYIGI